jgi:hypothetical protein
MSNLYCFKGKGRCAGATAYVLGVTEVAAKATLLRECLHFDIDTVQPFISPPIESVIDDGEVLLVESYAARN